MTRRPFLMFWYARCSCNCKRGEFFTCYSQKNTKKKTLNRNTPAIIIRATNIIGILRMANGNRCTSIPTWYCNKIATNFLLKNHYMVYYWWLCVCVWMWVCASVINSIQYVRKVSRRKQKRKKQPNKHIHHFEMILLHEQSYDSCFKRFHPPEQWNRLKSNLFLFAFTQVNNNELCTNFRFRFFNRKSLRLTFSFHRALDIEYCIKSRFINIKVDSIIGRNHIFHEK